MGRPPGPTSGDTLGRSHALKELQEGSRQTSPLRQTPAQLHSGSQEGSCEGAGETRERRTSCLEGTAPGPTPVDVLGGHGCASRKLQERSRRTPYTSDPTQTSRSSGGCSVSLIGPAVTGPCVGCTEPHQVSSGLGQWRLKRQVLGSGGQDMEPTQWDGSGRRPLTGPSLFILAEGMRSF